jgi:uncharacterized membrane protein
MSVLFELAQLGLSLFLIILPIFVLYIAYLIVTKAFKDMGFSSLEAIIIIFISFIFVFDIVFYGFNISNIYLFSYQNWLVGINTGGAVIPIILSIYLTKKKDISLKKVGIGILIVTIVTFFVTYPVAEKGIVSPFPYWLLPAIFASITSIILLWNNFQKAAPLAYISGTIGVLIGADFLHLPELLSIPIQTNTFAVIGGANVFDMVFITGILAVIVDGILMYRRKKTIDDNQS